MKANVFEHVELGVYPTETKIKLDSNQIKKQYFKELEPYFPEILNEVDEKGKIIWLNTGMGYLWFEMLTKKKPPSVFVPKNKVNKMYGFANRIKI